MKNKKNILYIIIGLLFLIILILFLLLFMPVKNTNELYSIQDYINVENEIKEEYKINEETNEEVNVVESIDLEVDSSKIQEVVDSIEVDSNILGAPITFDSNTLYEDGEFITSDNSENYIEALNQEKTDYGVSEEFAKEMVDINYYPEDCFYLIQKNILGEDLEITESTKTPIIYNLDCYGVEGFFRVFDVYNKKTNTTEDSIAINLVTGDMFGYTPETILYDYDYYIYNPDYNKNTMEVFEHGKVINPYEKSLLWDRLYKCLSEDRYYKAILTHIKDTDGTHYYKIYWEDIDDYILVDYYSGDMVQVVDGVKSSVIDAFK